MSGHHGCLPPVRVTTFTTPVGKVRALEVEGSWDPACSARFWDEECDGIQWRPPKARALDCDHLVECRSQLRWLSVRADGIDDRAIAELDQLVSLDALTRARNPLDLSALTGLRHLSVDDRPGLEGFAQPALHAAYLGLNKRGLGDLEPATGLTSVKLEGSWTHTVDMRARLPRLTHLMVQTSRVDSLEGLDAPELVSLDLDGRRSDHVLDLAPLAALRELRWVTVRGPRAVRNARVLTSREGVHFGPHGSVHVEP